MGSIFTTKSDTDGWPALKVDKLGLYSSSPYRKLKGVKAIAGCNHCLIKVSSLIISPAVMFYTCIQTANIVSVARGEINLSAL